MPRFDVATTSPAKQQADLLLLPAFQGPEAGPGIREVGRALEVDIVVLLQENGFRGSLGEVYTLPTLGRAAPRNVAVVGLGPKGEASADLIRRAAGKVAGIAGRYQTVASSLPAAGRGPWQLAVQAF
ncbi:MAG: M17 family peptidase N-terminal domain-containing protein, partial [Actinomycetota bacterium]